MWSKLESVEKRYESLMEALGNPSVIEDQKRYQQVAKECNELEEIIYTYRNYIKTAGELEENRELLRDEDEELRYLARMEIPILEEKIVSLENKLKLLLLPKDPNDEKNIIIEIRAGTGGEEAALFVADLFRMYTKYAEFHTWHVDIMSRHETGVGGFKEIIAMISGKGVYSKLKYESGTHRVQRVPITESQGRIHTSAVTVAVLPEAEEVDITINPEDLRIDVFRSSGPGGQSVNTTDSAVRITHIPTGTVVSCQDEKSQHKNKAKAMKILCARLMDKMKAEQQAEISETRRLQVGSGDRSERIRTYNFPQGRVTDHRIGFTLYNLDRVLEGELDEVIERLTTHYQAEAISSIN
ncbi:MAG: peptide chain release factor 1 [Thermodesulfobacteriota bacterium]|nr:peptide chain release factor 1 [Thermodesulfobacteriota bacterium]